jgi:hypothetical protein
MTRTELRGGSATWQEAWRFPWWMIGLGLGGLLCQQERFSAVGELVRATWLNRFGESEGFVGHPGEVGNAIAELVGPAPPPGRTWTLAVWTWWSEHLRSREWLRERYADWLEADGQPDASMAEFDMIAGIADALRTGDNVVAFWSLQRNAAARFARRLYGDPGIRADVANAVGVDLEVFDQRAPDILASAQGVGDFPRTREIANILRTGSFR